MLPNRIYVEGSSQLVLEFPESLAVRGYPIDIDISLFEVFTNGSSLPRRIASVNLDDNDPSRLLIRVSGARLVSAREIDFSYVVEGVDGPVGQLMINSSKIDLESFGPLAVNEARPGDNERNIGQAFSTLTATIDRSRSVGGNSNDNSIVGNSNGNIIDGKLGADTMIGGLGDDTYYIDNAGDIVQESSDEGNDLVVSLLDLTLPANIERGEIRGNAITISGNSLDNTLIGNTRDNILRGGTGADIMLGLRGDDTYYVNDVNDIVIEKGGISQRGGPRDRDLIYSDVSYTLPEWVEKLVLTEEAGAANAVGTNRWDTIIGNSFDNRINGMGLGDTLTGGGGADVFIIDTKPFVFRSRTVPLITDFEIGVDKLEIHAEEFRLDQPENGLSFKAVTSRKELRKGLSQPISFVYYVKEGRSGDIGELYINLNGMTAGAGSGGMMTVFSGGPALRLEDLNVVFPQPDVVAPDVVA